MKAWHLVLLVFLAFVATWCVADWFYVRASAEVKKEINQFDWGFALFPAVAGLAVLKKKKEVTVIYRILLSIGTALVFAFACVAWVWTFGVPFHFSLGGRL